MCKSPCFEIPDFQLTTPTSKHPINHDPASRQLPSCLFSVRLSAVRVGAWLSLVERLVWDQEVVGSNPAAPIS